MVAADMQRPAAVEQLKVLGEQIDVSGVQRGRGDPARDLPRPPTRKAKRLGRDVIVYDTAGRLAIDELLMHELGDIKGAVSPDNIFLVIDAMIGQDAVKTAAAFNERLGITGVVLTKLDGDGARRRRSQREGSHGRPRTVLGPSARAPTSSKSSAPKAWRGASLGMGDVVGLMKDFEGRRRPEEGPKKTRPGCCRASSRSRISCNRSAPSSRWDR